MKYPSVPLLLGVLYHVWYTCSAIGSDDVIFLSQSDVFMTGVRFIAEYIGEETGDTEWTSPDTCKQTTIAKQIEQFVCSQGGEVDINLTIGDESESFTVELERSSVCYTWSVEYNTEDISLSINNAAGSPDPLLSYQFYAVGESPRVSLYCDKTVMSLTRGQFKEDSYKWVVSFGNDTHYCTTMHIRGVPVSLNGCTVGESTQPINTHVLPEMKDGVEASSNVSKLCSDYCGSGVTVLLDSSKVLVSADGMKNSTALYLDYNYTVIDCGVVWDGRIYLIVDDGYTLLVLDNFVLSKTIYLDYRTAHIAVNNKCIKQLEDRHTSSTVVLWNKSYFAVLHENDITAMEIWLPTPMIKIQAVSVTYIGITLIMTDGSNSFWFNYDPIAQEFTQAWRNVHRGETYLLPIPESSDKLVMEVRTNAKITTANKVHIQLKDQNAKTFGWISIESEFIGCGENCLGQAYIPWHPGMEEYGVWRIEKDSSYLHVWFEGYKTLKYQFSNNCALKQRPYYILFDSTEDRLSDKYRIVESGVQMSIPSEDECKIYGICPHISLLETGSNLYFMTAYGRSVAPVRSYVNGDVLSAEIQSVAISGKDEFAILSTSKELLYGYCSKSSVLTVGEGFNSSQHLMFDGNSDLYFITDAAQPTLIPTQILLKKALDSDSCSLKEFSSTLGSSLLYLDIGENTTYTLTLTTSNYKKPDILYQLYPQGHASANMTSIFTASDLVYGENHISQNVAIKGLENKGVSVIIATPDAAHPPCPTAHTDVAYVVVDCPKSRHLEILDKPADCDQYINMSMEYTIPGKYNYNRTEKIVEYDLEELGCPITWPYDEKYLPDVWIFDNGEPTRKLTNDFVLKELNGRNDYNYTLTVKEVGCLRVPQSWDSIGDNWGPQNYQSCFHSVDDELENEAEQSELNRKAVKNKQYEILNGTDVNSNKISFGKHLANYTFELRVLDPTASYCTLTVKFAVWIQDAPNTSDLGIIVLVLACLVMLVILALSYVQYKKSILTKANQVLQS